MNPQLRKEIRKFGESRGTDVIVFFFPEGTTKLIDHSDVPILYRCLKSVGTGRHIDVLLQTDGGSVSAARRLALLLRAYSDKISIFVLYKARSAGTLIAMIADEIKMSALSELGPLDPNLIGNNGIQGVMPGKISSEEVRLFTEMMAKWFGLNTERQRANALEMLSQKIFPSTLVTLYRAERYIEGVTAEIVGYHLPKRSKRIQRRLVDKLVSGYWDHGHGITQSEGLALGLKTKRTSSHEEAVMEQLRLELSKYCEQAKGAIVAVCNAVLFSEKYSARFVQRWTGKQEEGQVVRAGTTERGVWEEL